MFRRAIISLAVVPLLAAVLLLNSATPAEADSHWVRGTYQAFVEGLGAPENLILLPDHTLGPAGSYPDGTWTVRKHMVSISYTGGEAPVVSCEHAGLGAICYFTMTYDGPKTPTGIPSEAEPGTASAYIGSISVISWPFWALRTGGVRSGAG